MNSADAGAVAVRVRKKRQCAGVDNNHTKMLSAVTAYYILIRLLLTVLKLNYI